MKETEAQRKHVLNRWNQQKQYLSKDPLVRTHWQDLQAQYNSGHPAIFAFKEKIGPISVPSILEAAPIN